LTRRLAGQDDPPSHRRLLGGDAMDVAGELRISISRVCDLPAEAVSDEASLDELGFDSLAAAEVLTDLEIRLGRDLPVDGLRRLIEARTVGDVVAVLRDELGRTVG